MSDLLEAFLDAETDQGTIRFLLEALENATSDYWDPLLEPFVQDPSAILQVLASNSNAVEQAKEVLETRQRSAAPIGELQEAGTSITTEDNANPVTLAGKYTAIPGAHNRAISLSQLRQVLGYIESHANPDGLLPWTDENEQSPTFGRQLTVQTMNLYHVVHWVIKPLTAQYKCSMVEILASCNGPQIPRWFVSHAWREPLCEMVSALARHAEIRGLDADETYYWVCGYANNQHNLNQDINPNPQKTSFYMALRQCEGMLLCLDTLGTPFHRIWCCFEQAMVVHEEHSDLFLDIATVVDGKTPAVITDSRAAPVAADLKGGPKFALEFKRDRESGFPLNLLERGYEIDISTAQAAREDDRRRILNTIRRMSTTGNDTNSKRDSWPLYVLEPTQELPPWPNADNCYLVLRNSSEAAALRTQLQSLPNGVSIPCRGRDRQKEPWDYGFCRIQNGELCFDYVSGDKESFSIMDIDFFELVHLVVTQNHQADISLYHALDCEEPNLTDPVFAKVNKVLRGIFAEAAARKAAEEGRIDTVIQVLKQDSDRKKLTLNLGGCSYLNLAELANLAGHPSLQQLTIDCSYSGVANVPRLADALTGLKCLQKLHLNFEWCTTLEESDVARLSDQGLVRLCSTLTDLTLDLKGCFFAVFLPLIETLQSLEKIFIDYSYSHTEAKGKTLAGILQLRRLRQLHLRFRACQHVSDVRSLKRLARLSNLETLVLDFDYTCLNNVDELGSLLELEHLSQCNLRFQKCTQITNIPWLTKLAHLPGLQLQIDLSECKGLEECLQKRFESQESLRQTLTRTAASLQSPSIMFLNGEKLEGSYLLKHFQAGESVEYLSESWKSWMPAVVQKVDDVGLLLNIADFRGRRQISEAHKKVVKAADIPRKVRKATGEISKKTLGKNVPLPFTSTNSESRRIEKPNNGAQPGAGGPNVDSPKNCVVGDSVKYLAGPHKGWKSSVAGKQDVAVNASYSDKSRLLKQFRAGDAVEYFSRELKGDWMSAVVHKVENNSLQLNVAGYRGRFRVQAADIPKKIRKTAKQKKQKRTAKIGQIGD